jgi:hypothetical protein
MTKVIRAELTEEESLMVLGALRICAPTGGGSHPFVLYLKLFD